MVSVAGDLPARYLFRQGFLHLDHIQIIPGIGAPREPDDPSFVGNLTRFVIYILNSVPDAADIGIGSTINQVLLFIQATDEAIRPLIILQKDRTYGTSERLPDALR